MTSDTDLLSPPAESPALARVQVTEPPSTPSVEHILMLAVEKGIDPANLERLVALHERVTAQRAEQAFNSAMAAFRAECPEIVKNQTAIDPRKPADKQHLYNFADLASIARVVDPVLLRHGLSYTWDTEMAGDLTVITCTVHHVDGGKRSSKFTCKGSGTSIMSAAQVAASATTFGRRYSLLFALGLTAGEPDDDGRSATPNPKPDANPHAPQHGTRAEGYAPKANGVTGAELQKLMGEWRDRAEKPAGTVGEFAAWARTVLKTDADLTHVRNWTAEGVAKCRETML